MNRYFLKFKAKLMYLISYIYGMRYWFSRKGFDETVRELDTPFKIASWLIANVEYTKDVGDYWQIPIETFNRRKGDCDDFGRFAQYCLNRHGYNSFLLVMWNKGSGHATALFKNREGYETVGTYGWIRHYTDNIDEVVGFFYTDFKEYMIFDENLNETEKS